MTYLSNNYRLQPRPKLRNLLEATLVTVVCTVVVLAALIILGYFFSR